MSKKETTGKVVEKPHKTLKEIERDYIASVLDAYDWNKLRSAKILGIDRTTLYSKIKRYNLRKKTENGSQ